MTFYHSNLAPSDSQSEGTKNKYSYMSKRPEPNKPKFEAFSIIRDKKGELINERKEREMRVATKKRSWKGNEKVRRI